MDSNLYRIPGGRVLVLPENVFTDIQDFVSETKDGLETGVSLFGVRCLDVIQRWCYAAGPVKNLIVYYYVVLAAAGPGPRATHQPAHYSSDNEYAAAIYNALRSALPSIQWLGELHVHPHGMTWLSAGDLETVKQLLRETSQDTLSPDEFIAGVMQRRPAGVDISALRFTRQDLEGTRMRVKRVPADSPMVRKARDVAARGALPLNTRFDENGEAGTAQREPSLENPLQVPPRVCQGWFARFLNHLKRRQKNDA